MQEQQPRQQQSSTTGGGQEGNNDDDKHRCNDVEHKNNTARASERMETNDSGGSLAAEPRIA